MAYVIEMIPKEEQRGYMIPGYKEIVPYSWVIDREKDVKLFKYWTSIEEPHEEYFALIWKEQVIKVVLIHDFIGEDIVRWKLYQYLNEPDEVMKELREAMKAYKYSGSPIPSLDAGIKDTIIDF